MKSIEGREKVREMCADLLQDESNLSGAWCEMAAWPESTLEMEDVLGRFGDQAVPVTLSGGLTGIAAGALPEGGAVVSTSMLRKMEMLDGNTVRAGAGITLEEMRAFLSMEAPDHFYPPDPTEETASVGGTLATDASGSDSFLYGSTRKWVEAVTMVIPSGKTLRLARGEYTFSGGKCTHPDMGTITLPELRRPQPVKNAAGYHIQPGMDLIDLFLGSEGTLAVITEADLKLAPKPEYIIDLAVFPEDEDAFWNLYTVLLSPGEGLRLRALEMMDGRCIRFLREHPGELPPPPPGAEFVILLRAEAEDDQGMEDSLMELDGLLTGCGVDPDSAWGGFEPTERKKIKDFRHALPESVNHRIAELRRSFPEIHKFGSDGAVAPSRLREYYNSCSGILEEKQLPYLIFGHAGQGHIHANAVPEHREALKRAEEAMEMIADKAVGMGGTISAEHGLGRLKLPFLKLMYSW